MPEAVRSRALSRILETEEPTPSDASDKEWQKVPAFSLRVELSHGRGVEGFAWAHYAGYQWSDAGEKEKLTLVFGPRALVLTGYNLRSLLREIDDGRRRTIRQVSDSEAKLAINEGEKDKALVTEIACLPAFDEIVNEIKGEDHGHKGGHAGRLQR